jgi:hypothetical protein
MGKKRRKKNRDQKIVTDKEGRHPDPQGVSVSLRGDDKGPAIQYQPGNQSFGELIEEAMEVAPLRRAPVARRRNNLDWLHGEGFINKRLYDAGMDFKADFDRGNLCALKASSLMRVSGSGACDVPVGIDLRAKIGRAFRAMGGLGSELTTVAWNCIGMEQPLYKQIDGTDRRWRQEERVRTLLIKSLHIIADIYRPEKRA